MLTTFLYLVFLTTIAKNHNSEIIRLIDECTLAVIPSITKNGVGDDRNAYITGPAPCKKARSFVATSAAS